MTRGQPVLRSPALHMAVGFALMGGWAVYANRLHPWPGPLVAGLVQGAISAVITLFLKRMVETVSARFPGPAALVLPPVLAFLFSLAVLTALHRIAGTPEILATIAVPLTVTTLYSATLALALYRSRK